MKTKINFILKEVLREIEPSNEEISIIGDSLKKFLKRINTEIKRLKIDAETFIGGSFAKNTMIKKGKYDIDVFLRFNKKYSDKEISKFSKEILKKFQKIELVHGSRDYFRVKINDFSYIELIPVIKVKNSREFRNITDLSYSHVKYVNKKLKSKKILDEVRLAKAFCYAHHCYGAESHIQGFSGYGLELLIAYYKSFLKFIKEIIKMRNKEVIDIEKKYKNKQEVLMNLNSSKLNSPIILIDPTCKQRNALAALSQETFERFQKECKHFLKNPRREKFEIEKIDFNQIKESSEKKGQEFILIEAKTKKPEGDIAGSKLLKFYKNLLPEIERFFDIKKKGFDYKKGKTAKYFFVVKRKKEIILEGPEVIDKKNSKAFKKAHKDYFVKKGKIYARKKIDFNIEEFIEKFKDKNKKKIKEMYIEKLTILKD
ncbi:MAG: nucleotidyltransferase domain-containing protein [Nanoarchaeota archaeon]|nr:nucleotidyltransferase domain-containing protein [Nanoarchaeota archaeon]